MLDLRHFSENPQNAQKPENQRTRLTKRLLRENLLELLKEKPVEYITVKELCEYAELNRSTFYAYYTDVPALYTTAPTEVDADGNEVTNDYANALSDRFLISSNYLSLQNITLGYTVPKEWTRKFGVEGIRIYGAAENVAVWAKRKGLDPRQGVGSAENYTYSPMRAISGGIRVNF